MYPQVRPQNAQRHYSLTTIPDLTKCILIPDEHGVHQPHVILNGNMRHVKNLVGPALPVPQLPSSQTSGMRFLGSTASSLHSSVSSQGSLGAQSNTR